MEGAANILAMIVCEWIFNITW